MEDCSIDSVRLEVTNREIAFFQDNPEQLHRLDSFLASQISDAMRSI